MQNNLGNAKGNSLVNQLKEFGCYYNWQYNHKKFEKRYEKNLATCLAHSKETPDPVVFNFLGLLYIKKNRLTKAKAAFKSALNLVADEPVAMANLANFYYNQGQTKAAQDCLDKLAGQKPETLRAWQHWSKAYMHIRLFKYRESLKEYDQAIANIIGLPEIYRYKVYLYKAIALNRIAKRSGKFNKAISTLRQAEALNQTDYLIYQHLAIAHNGLKQISSQSFEIAMKYFDQALKLQPYDKTTLKFLGKSLAENNDFANALKYFDESIKSSPTSSAYHNRAILYQKTKKFKEAQKDYEKSVELDEFNLPATFGLIKIYEINKEYSAAISLCQQVIAKANRPDPKRLDQLANLLDKTGEVENALINYEKILEIVSVKDRLALNAKNFLIKYRQECQKASNSIDLLIKWIKLMLRFDEYEQVKSILLMRLNYQSDCFILNYHYGAILIIQQDYQNAAGYLAKAFKITEDKAERKLCFQKLQAIYFSFAIKLDEKQNNFQTTGANIEVQLKEIKDKAGALWDTYAEIEMQWHKEDKLVWHSNFNLLYSSKNEHKVVSIDGNDIHKTLSNEIKEKHAALSKNPNKKTPKNINYANVRLSFIVSDRTHMKSGNHGRKIVYVPLSVKAKAKQVTHVSNYYTFFQFTVNQTQSVPRSMSLLKDVLASKPISKYSTIIEKYNETNPSKGFHREYHCSERALYGFLNQPETLEEIIDTIEAQSANQSKLKIYALIIDVHTERYLCNNCQESIFYWYDPAGQFAQKLIEKIQNRGHKVQTKTGMLDIIVRVSAEKPASAQAKQPATIHSNDSINIKEQRTYHNGVLLLQRDDSIIENPEAHSRAFINQKKFTK